MIILGIDPGTSLIGYGIIETLRNGYRAVTYGTCVTPPRIDAYERLPLIQDFFTKIIKKYKPEHIGLEQLFFSRNVSTAMGVSEVRGVLIALAAQYGIPISQFTPPQVKRAVSASGAAGKQQVQAMVKLILSLKEIPKPDDAADALAIAICSANTIVE